MMKNLSMWPSMSGLFRGVGLAFLVVGLAGLSMLAPAVSHAEGVAWANLTIDQALSEAAKTGKVIMVNVHSSHCGGCAQLEADVWSTPAGAEVADGLIPIQVDNGGTDGAYLQTRYPVTGLPAVIFIGPDGKEVDRVVGYMRGKQAFLAEALPLKDGMDRLPAMEQELAAHPDSLPLLLPVLERRLNRFQDQNADLLVNKILKLDSANRAMQAEKVINLMTRYYSFVRLDTGKAEGYWRLLLDQYPTASSTGGAVNELYKLMSAKGQTEQWKAYMCDLAEKQATNGKLLAYIAYTAARVGVTDPRLAKAARTARAQGQGRADLDSIAVVLEGKGSAGSSGSPKTPGK
jgi:thioredoxin 1